MATTFQTGPEALAYYLLALTYNRGIQLTEHGENLIRLSASAWFTDLRLRNGISPENARELAQRIIELASNERHVTSALENSDRVDFFSWFYALGRSGRKILGPIVDKGF